jgi:hypothetical protein
MSRKLIGLSGFAGSGKDEAARGLVTAGWRRIALADPMRELLLRIDPFIGESGDRLSYLVGRFGWDACKRSVPEFRRLLIATGESARDVFGHDCWLRAAEQKPVWNSYQPVVVSDIRPHDGEHLSIEADWVHLHGGIVVRVERPGQPSSGIDHYTETNLQHLPYDAVLVNCGTVEDLHDGIRELASQYFGGSERKNMSEQIDGQDVQRLGDEVKIVRGIWYSDGVPYRRWMPACKDGKAWYGHDDAEIIQDVDAVLEMDKLDSLVKE